MHICIQASLAVSVNAFGSRGGGAEDLPLDGPMYESPIWCISRIPIAVRLFWVDFPQRAQCPACHTYNQLALPWEYRLGTYRCRIPLITADRGLGTTGCILPAVHTVPMYTLHRRLIRMQAARVRWAPPEIHLQYIPYVYTRYAVWDGCGAAEAWAHSGEGSGTTFSTVTFCTLLCNSNA